VNKVADSEWAAAMRSADLQRAWEISDRSLREYCKSSVQKHAGERHLQRIWRGEDLRNRRVLVRCYHGLGDTIQFIRFAKPLRANAREVIVWCQPELLELLGKVDGVDRVYPLHDGTPDFSYDVDIEVMELAHALRVTPKVVSERIPYFSNRILKQPTSGSTDSIGLVWEVGNWDRHRCVPAQELGRLGTIPGIDLFSLQQGPGRGSAAVIPAKDIATPDIDTLATTIMSLDLVITVDTMVAHLAGALGAPVWTMLHADCDWRWPETGRSSMWYPTMKLFHQPRRGDWKGVIDSIADELNRRHDVGSHDEIPSRITAALE
jgi:hypothetical protein